MILIIQFPNILLLKDLLVLLNNYLGCSREGGGEIRAVGDFFLLGEKGGERGREGIYGKPRGEKDGEHG
jgi:hypothetical protein